MKLSLVRANLIHQWMRSLVAIAGIAFAIILVFLQLGFLGSAEAAASMLYDRLDFELILVSTEYVQLSRTGTFPRSRLAQVESFPGIASAVPVYIGFQMWRNPEPDSRRRRNMLVVGFQPNDHVFQMEEVEQASTQLKQRDRVLIDRRSRPEFGPLDVGVTTELGTHRVTIAGQFSLGTGFVADGMVLVSDQTYARIFPEAALRDVSLGVIKLQPGYTPRQVVQELRGALANDVQVLTRSEIVGRERRHWVERTPLGTVFRFGVFVALAVGAVFLYQVMSSDITNHLSEYATLKALGCSKTYLTFLVLQQAYYLALLAYVPGLLISLALYALTRYVAAIPIGMNLGRALGVLLMSLGMCSISGLLAMREVAAADPADLL